MNLGFSRRNVVRHGSQKPRRSFKRRRLFFDRLEDRQLLSIAPSGGQFTVNDTTAGLQVQSGGVAMDNNGDAVVAWSSQVLDSNGQPTGNSNVMFKLYSHNADGTFSGGSETVVATTNMPDSALVARAPTTGEFVVVWMTSWVNKSGNTEFKTYAEPFDSAGNSLTGNKPVLVGGATDNHAEGVAMNDNGFDVLYGVNNTFPYYVGSAAKVPTVERFTASGIAEGTPITATSGVASSDGNSSIAMDANGDFVVGWEYRTGAPQMTYAVNARYFSAAGAAEGGILHISSVHHQLEGVRVGMDAAGNSVFTWQEYDRYSNGSFTSIEYAKTATAPNAQGVSTLGSPITVAQYGVNNAPYPEGYPKVAVQPNGNFAITWLASDLATQPTYSVWTDTLSAAGSALEAPFEVSTLKETTSWPSNYNPWPSVATDSTGDLLVIWNDVGGNPSDTGDVYGRFYTDPPAPAIASASAAQSASSGMALSGPSPASTDAVFAAYAYPSDGDTLG